MSAWIVSKRHIDALVTAALPFKLRWRRDEVNKELTHERGEVWGPGAISEHKRAWSELDLSTAGRTGAMLWNENHLSVNHRYNENETEDPYVFAKYPRKLTLPAVVKALDCYEYQSCEHPDWEDSEARRFCRALREAILDKLVAGEEYEAAPWGID